MRNKLNIFDQIIERSGSDSVKWRRYPADVLPLWVADMDFPVLPEIISALQERISHPVFGYAVEDTELREIFCEWLYRHHEWIVDPDEIITMTGVVRGLNLVAQSFVDYKEYLAFLTPIYPPFFRISEYAGCGKIEIPLTQGEEKFGIDFDSLDKSLSNSTRVFFLCNPHNPVGRVFNNQELEKIGEICLRKDILICSDEIHCDLVFSQNKHIPIASLSSELAQHCITLMSPSKIFNMPGLQLSFAIVQNEDLRKRLLHASKGLVGQPNILASIASKAAYKHGSTWRREMCNYLESNRDFLMNFLDERVPMIKMAQPEGTYLAWLDCRKMDNNKSAYQFFLDNAGVALNDGVEFGKDGNGFVRLNFGCPRLILKEALERMERAIYNIRI